MKSGKIVESCLGKLMVIYKQEKKENKSGVNKGVSKLFNAFMWLKGEPKFGTHFLKWHESSLDNVLVGSDSSTPEIKRNYRTPNDNKRRPHIGHDKAKKKEREERRILKKAKQSK